MERVYPECGTPKSLQTLPNGGYPAPRNSRKKVINGFGAGVGLWLLIAAVSPVTTQAQQAQDSTQKTGRPAASEHWWTLFATGFASSILAHESGHVVAAYAVGGKPSFGFNEARPTIYSGIDARLQPRKQFVFSAAGLTVQTVVDEGILDVPHAAGRAGPFERGMLAGGIATSLFYVTIGRNGSVSDVEYMARTSRLSKTAITAIYGGTALIHIWRIEHNNRYADFFARPNPDGGMRIGVNIDR
jgi:hypothetical protein